VRRLRRARARQETRGVGFLPRFRLPNQVADVPLDARGENGGWRLEKNRRRDVGETRNRTGKNRRVAGTVRASGATAVASARFKRAQRLALLLRAPDALLRERGVLVRPVHPRVDAAHRVDQRLDLLLDQVVQKRAHLRRAAQPAPLHPHLHRAQGVVGAAEGNAGREGGAGAARRAVPRDRRRDTPRGGPATTAERGERRERDSARSQRRRRNRALRRRDDPRRERGPRRRRVRVRRSDSVRSRGPRFRHVRTPPHGRIRRTYFLRPRRRVHVVPEQSAAGLPAGAPVVVRVVIFARALVGARDAARGAVAGIREPPTACRGGIPIPIPIPLEPTGALPADVSRGDEFLFALGPRLLTLLLFSLHLQLVRRQFELGLLRASLSFLRLLRRRRGLLLRLLQRGRARSLRAGSFRLRAELLHRLLRSRRLLLFLLPLSERDGMRLVDGAGARRVLRKPRPPARTPKPDLALPGGESESRRESDGKHTETRSVRLSSAAAFAS